MAGPISTLSGVVARLLLPPLALACGLAHGRTDQSLEAQLEPISEMVHFVPEKALVQLLRLQEQGRVAPTGAKAEYLTQMSVAERGIGQHNEAIALADEVIALGTVNHDNAAVAKGLLAKGEVMLAMNDLKASHKLRWEGEKIANATSDLRLRVQAAVSAGQACAEEGNFPAALTRLQTAVNLARQLGKPVVTVTALDALGRLYRQMHEYDKGFATLREAYQIARDIDSPGRIAALKNSEYRLAVESNQAGRAQTVLLSALALQREIADTATIGITLVNLSDSYLNQKNYPKTVVYARQALDAARRVKDMTTEAAARVNLGEAQIGMGRLADGKRNFETGFSLYEKAGDQPELQALLLEYGAALEAAGDAAGAITAYHHERAISNALFEKQRQKAVWELQERYEADSREHRIILLSRENQVKSAEISNHRLQQRVWWLLATVFALASAIVFILYRKVRHANAQLQVKNLELKHQSSRDPLTALYNRRHFQEFMRTHVQTEKRGAGTSGEEIVGALFLLDVDHFKHVNDTHGHAAGDAVLKMIAENLAIILRETDVIVRWGGEEFLAFLPAIARSGIEEIARRLLTGISEQVVDYQGTKISVNVSIGFSPYPLAPGGQPLSWERAVNLVDMALYLAKSHGRNRAYGVRSFASVEHATLESIEQDLESAWRDGFVDVAVVLGDAAAPATAGTPEPLGTV